MPKNGRMWADVNVAVSLDGQVCRDLDIPIPVDRVGHCGLTLPPADYRWNRCALEDQTR